MSAVSGHKCLKDQTATDETSEMQHELELELDEFSLAEKRLMWNFGLHPLLYIISKFCVLSSRHRGNCGWDEGMYLINVLGSRAEYSYGWE